MRNTPSSNTKRIVSFTALIACAIALLLLLNRAPVEAQAPTLEVDNSGFSHTISDYIYGVNLAQEAMAANWQLPVNRYGGNGVTRYNWKIDVYNPGNYWYFENINNEPELTSPVGSAADRFIEQNERTGTASLMQVSMIGWTPKSRDRDCGFHWDLYGWQTDTDWGYNWGCGNGVSGATNEYITGNDPTDTSYAIDETFTAEWVTHLTTQFGTADNGGVQFYALDNEPMIWHFNHRDVHPQFNDYATVLNKGIAHASAIKSVDPSALVMGPGPWGWGSFFDSALDINTPDSNPDRDTYGMDFIPWYLQEMKAYEDANGVRLLDILDIHYYPQGYIFVDGQWVPMALGPAGDDAAQALRTRSTRDLWDPNYTAESWISQPTYVIPRMKAWINQHYNDPNNPIKLAISEYSWGADEHINGALAQADVLGIFGREDVYMAALWPEADLAIESPVDYAFRMYRNYDGNGATFGDKSLDATSTDLDQLSIYASVDEARQVMTIMVINKTKGDLTSSVAINGTAVPAGNVPVYRYTEADITGIAQDVVAVTPNAINDTFPAESISLYEVPLVSVPSAITLVENSAETTPPSIIVSTLGVAMLATLSLVAMRRRVLDPIRHS